MGGGGGLMRENLSGRLWVEPDQVMGKSGFKPESKFTAQVIIQHCEAERAATRS